MWGGRARPWTGRGSGSWSRRPPGWRSWAGTGRSSPRRTSANCGHLLDLQPALWTFPRRPGVEPTNNGRASPSPRRAVAVHQFARSLVEWRFGMRRFANRLGRPVAGVLFPPARERRQVPRVVIPSALVVASLLRSRRLRRDTTGGGSRLSPRTPRPHGSRYCGVLLAGWRNPRHWRPGRDGPSVGRRHGNPEDGPSRPNGGLFAVLFAGWVHGGQWRCRRGGSRVGCPQRCPEGYPRGGQLYRVGV